MKITIYGWSTKRVQQSRRKGASIGDAVSVAVPSRWANPYRHVRPHSVAVVLYRDLHLPSRPTSTPANYAAGRWPATARSTGHATPTCS